jgi:hypothetical protein
MFRFAGLLFRLVMAVSLMALPWTQSWAMTVVDREAPAMPCHLSDDGDSSGKPSSENKADGCCELAQCHCISAIALPVLLSIGSDSITPHWDAWSPAQPRNPFFAPTPPPPRA